MLLSLVLGRDVEAAVAVLGLEALATVVLVTVVVVLVDAAAGFGALVRVARGDEHLQTVLADFERQGNRMKNGSYVDKKAQYPTRTYLQTLRLRGQQH